MGRRTLALLILALAIPAVALATKPQNPSTPTSQSKAAPKVLYVLKGTL
jgi:hypothetical protein